MWSQKDWSLADTRLYEVKWEAKLLEAFVQLKLERPKWILDSPIDFGNTISYKIYVTKCFFFFFR